MKLLGYVCLKKRKYIIFFLQRACFGQNEPSHGIALGPIVEEEENHTNDGMEEFDDIPSGWEEYLAAQEEEIRRLEESFASSQEETNMAEKPADTDGPEEMPLEEDDENPFPSGQRIRETNM